MGTLLWGVTLALEDLKLDCDIESRATGMELERDAPGDCLRAEATRNNKKGLRRSRQGGVRSSAWHLMEARM